MSDSEEEVTEEQYKLVLIGDPCVGKTALASKFAHDTFSKQYNPTVGVEFYLKRLMLPGNRPVALKLWDIGGASLDGSMMDKYIFRANAILLVYDVSNFNSFENLDEWLKQCNRALGQISSASKTKLALVANKIDLEHMRSVKSDKHHHLAQEHGLLTYAVSAKSGEGVNICFQKIAAELLGIKLTRIDQEEHHQVVKAEILTPRPDRIIANSSGSVRTAVCTLQ